MTTTYEETHVPEETITSEACSAAYFAGYLANKCTKQYECSTCEDLLIEQTKLTEKRYLLILNKIYGNVCDVSTGLHAPTADFLHIVDKCLNVFEKFFPEIYHEKQLKSKFLKEFMNDLEVSLWLQGETCRDHRVFILEQLVTSKLFYKCKMMLKGKSLNKHSKVSKIRILKNN